MFAFLLIIFTFFVYSTQTSLPTFTYICLHHKHQRTDLGFLIRYFFLIQCSVLHYFVGFDCFELKQSGLEGKSFHSNFFLLGCTLYCLHCLFCISAWSIWVFKYLLMGVCDLRLHKKLFNSHSKLQKRSAKCECA